MKTFKFISTLVIGFCSLSIAADLNVAVIDYEKAFDAYSKTVEFKDIIKEKQEVFQKELESKKDELKNYEEKIINLQKQIQDPAIAQTIKAKAQADLQALVQKGTAEEQVFNQQAQKTRQSLQVEMSQQRELILRDMRATVNKYAKEKGYDMVLDASDSNTGRTAFVLYADAKYDITQAIIDLLNQ